MVDIAALKGLVKGIGNELATKNLTNAAKPKPFTKLPKGFSGEVPKFNVGPANDAFKLIGIKQIPKNPVKHVPTIAGSAQAAFKNTSGKI